MRKQYLIKNILAEIIPQIEEECVAEGYPSNGSNFEIRLAAEEEWLESMTLSELLTYWKRIG